MGMKKVAMAVIGALMVVQGVQAHHSVSGAYDVANHVKVSGTVSKVEWINPHSFVHVDAKDANGKPVTWTFESLPTAFFKRAGITKEMLLGKVGEQVVVTGQPARDGTKRLAILSTITYSDGHEYKLGVEPSGADVTAQYIK